MTRIRTAIFMGLSTVLLLAGVTLCCASYLVVRFGLPALKPTASKRLKRKT